MMRGDHFPDAFGRQSFQYCLTDGICGMREMTPSFFSPPKQREDSMKSRLGYLEVNRECRFGDVNFKMSISISTIARTL